MTSAESLDSRSGTRLPSRSGWASGWFSSSSSGASSPLFVTWNPFGILDLVVALGMGGAVALGLVEAKVTMAPVAQLPLALIPAYLVPTFVMLHLAALFQARRLATSGRVLRARTSQSS